MLEGGCSIEAGGGGVEWRGGEEVLSLFAVGPFGIVFCLTNTLSLTLHTLALSLSLSLLLLELSNTLSFSLTHLHPLSLPPSPSFTQLTH